MSKHSDYYFPSPKCHFIHIKCLQASRYIIMSTSVVTRTYFNNETLFHYKLFYFCNN